MRCYGLLCLAACQPALVAEVEEPRPPGVAEQRSVRDLAPGATFGDVIRAARMLDEHGEDSSERGCLFQVDGDRAAMTADVAIAVRPLPDAPVDLGARLGGAAGPIRILSRWDLAGTGEVAVVVITSTPAPPSDARWELLALTERGIYRRLSNRAVSREEGGPLALDLVLEQLGDSTRLIVTADHGQSLSGLLSLLSALPADQVVGLGIVLPADIRLPNPRVTNENREHLCEHGLAAPTDGRSAGTLAGPDILSVAAGLRPEFTRCLNQASGRAAAGGRFQVRFRIGDQGGVEQACLRQPTSVAPDLETCILAAVRDASFPAPDPVGFVDVSLPLELQPIPMPPPTPVCHLE